MLLAQPSALTSWLSFYEITGSASAALTGLQFIVITLLAQNQAPGGMQEIRAFGSPTVFHFCASLLVSATMSAPWPSLAALSYCLTAYGVLGIAYSLRVLWHSRASNYIPDTEDRLWYLAMPVALYAALFSSSILLWWNLPAALFMVAIVTLAFLFVGIHNSWDTVTYMVVQHRQQRNQSPDNEDQPPQ